MQQHDASKQAKPCDSPEIGSKASKKMFVHLYCRPDMNKSMLTHLKTQSVAAAADLYRHAEGKQAPDGHIWTHH